MRFDCRITNARIKVQTHTNCHIFNFFHSKNCYSNTPQCNVNCLPLYAIALTFVSPQWRYVCSLWGKNRIMWYGDEFRPLVRVMAQAVICRSLTMVARFQSLTAPCGICGWERGIEKKISPSIFFPHASVITTFSSTSSKLLAKERKAGDALESSSSIGGLSKFMKPQGRK